MENKTGLAVRVGIFIVVGILLLLGLSLRVDRNLFKKPMGTDLQANFENIKGLEIGDPVLLGGMNVGTVSEMRFDAEKGRVEVMMFIRSPYRLKTDSLALIRLQSLLGRYCVSVDFGDPSSPDLPYGGLLKTEETMDIDGALQIVSDVGKEIRELADGFNENQDKLTSEISSLIEENRENIRKTTESFAKLGPKMEKTLDSFNGIMGKVSRGEGTFGKLFTDDSLYYRITNAADGFTSLTADVRSGDGTLSQLIYSDTLSVSVEDTFDKVRGAAGKMDDFFTGNSEKIDDFINSLKDLTPKLEETIENLREISQKVNEGDGTLGKMINDPSLFDDTRSTVNQIKATFEESEEQSVMRTVLSVLIGPVM